MKILITFCCILTLSMALRAQSLSPTVMATSGDYYSGANVTLSWTLGELATETLYGGNNILTQGFQQPGESGLKLDLYANLQGPYSGGSMLPNLVGVMPLSQPYHVFPWLYAGTEAVAAIPNANVVDWVLVELRDAATASAATSATTVARQAGFMLANGKITGLDGISGMAFNVTITQNLFVVIWHRNHLAIMNANTIPLVGGYYTYNFTTGAAQVYGGANAHKQLAPGVWGMTGGDGDGSKQVNNADKNDVWKPQSGSSGYKAGDFNMNGQVDNVDKIDIWVGNSGSGSGVPN